MSRLFQARAVLLTSCIVFQHPVGRADPADDFLGERLQRCILSRQLIRMKPLHGLLERTAYGFPVGVLGHVEQLEVVEVGEPRVSLQHRAGQRSWRSGVVPHDGLLSGVRRLSAVR